MAASVYKVIHLVANLKHSSKCHVDAGDGDLWAHTLGSGEDGGLLIGGLSNMKGLIKGVFLNWDCCVIKVFTITKILKHWW